MKVSTRPLSDALGGEVIGLDPREPLDAAAVGTLLAAWHEHLVLLIRGHEMTTDQQLAFATHFGTLAERPKPLEERPEGPDSDPRVILISNIKENGRHIGSLPYGDMWFHHDTAQIAEPHRATMLHALELPSTGGNTLFANMYLAYDGLPEKIKTRLDGVLALQAFDYTQTAKVDPWQDLSGIQHHAHPAAITHPATGRKALYVNRLMTVRLEGMDRTESDDLLEVLFEHAERPEIVYEHVWRKGDLLIWDNRCSTHARTDYPPAERRLLRRVSVLGERPQA